MSRCLLDFLQIFLWMSTIDAGLMAPKLLDTEQIRFEFGGGANILIFRPAPIAGSAGRGRCLVAGNCWGFVAVPATAKLLPCQPVRKQGPGDGRQLVRGFIRG